MADIESIKNQIRDEIRVDDEGNGFATIRAAARLADVNFSALSRHFASVDKKPSKLAELLLQYGFNPLTFSESGIPDGAVAIIAKYYAWMAGERCTEQAKQIDLALSATSVRVLFQEIAGWLPAGNRKLTPERIAEICLLPDGRTWKPRFESDFYDQLSKLTGLQQFGNSRPKLWAQLTDEWVYKMLPPGIRDGVKAAKTKTGGWRKLHQFLSDDGLEVFGQHMATLLILMKAAETVNGVRRSLQVMTRTDYQHRLFEDCRKDGQLTVRKQLTSTT